MGLHFCGAPHPNRKRFSSFTDDLQAEEATPYHNPTAEGFVVTEVPFEAANEFGVVTHRGVVDEITFPEIGPARLYKSKKAVVTFDLVNYEVNPVIDWEDGLNKSGRVMGMVIQMRRTTEEPTPYIPWGPEDQERDRMAALEQARSDYTKEGDPWEARFLEHQIAQLEKPGSVPAPWHEAQYFGQPQFTGEVIAPAIDGAATYLLCCIYPDGSPRINVFVTLNILGVPSTAFYQVCPE